jgi:ribosomal protein S18 acetylase RimI-like enzyme
MDNVLNTGNIIIRHAVKEDCPRMMELIKELAEYEKAPDAVTVNFNHFVESGFGEKPVWWAFVATSPQPSPFGEGWGEVEEQNLAIKQAEKNKTQSSLSSSPFPPPLGEIEGAGGQVVGFALYYIRYSTWKGQRLYLEDLIVTDKMRGKGIGKLLLDRLKEECKEKKYSGMLWQVLDWNEPAINFYKKYNNVHFDAEWVNCSIEII